MLPEVERYFDAVNADYNIYRARRRQVDIDHPSPQWRLGMTADERAEFYRLEREREIALHAARQEERERLAAAIDHLKESDDPIVKWMADTPDMWNEYRGHVETVLKALPMTREQMEIFGEGQSWCSEYERFLNMADAAGVLPESDPNKIDITPIVSRLVEWYGASGRRMFREMIEEVMPKVLEDAHRKWEAQAKRAESVNA